VGTEQSEWLNPKPVCNIPLAFSKNFKDNMIETSVELYYKDLFNLIENGQSAVGNINYDVEDLYTYGRG
jgi:hypothetical protein